MLPRQRLHQEKFQDPDDSYLNISNISFSCQILENVEESSSGQSSIIDDISENNEIGGIKIFEYLESLYSKHKMKQYFNN